MASIIFEEGLPNPPAPVQRKQLLNNIVDGLALVNPDVTYAECPRSPTSYDQGFEKITWSSFANIINGLAWWLTNALGPGEGFPTVAYIGPFDIRYNALALGAVKAGYKLLCLSPRNSVPGQQKLLKDTDCHIMITPRPQPPPITAILAASNLKVLEIPSVEELLSKRYAHFPYTKTFATARKEPLVVLHTSGTTGFPKPIIWTHDYAASWQVWTHIVPPDGYFTVPSMVNGARLFNTFPPFHAGGFFASFLIPIFGHGSIIFPLAGAIPSPQIVMDGLRHTRADLAVLPPPFMEEISQNPDMLDFFAENTTSIFYAGGGISESAGNVISKKMRIWSFCGITEAGCFPSIYPIGEWAPEYWKYMQFHPDIGIEFQHYAEDLFEAVIKRSDDPEKQPPCFSIFPDSLEYRTKDLYSQHPTKPGLWQYRARVDDIIIFLTGEKTNPISMEQHIMHHAPNVKGAVVMGTLRLQAALLIELETTEKLTTSEKAETIQQLWPTIQEANKEAPSFARIDKSHILFTDPHRPMERAGKGTIQKKSTLAKYSKEIDVLYADTDKVSATIHEKTHSKTTIDTSSITSVSTFVREAVISLTGFADLEDRDDFFVRGMDSLQTIQLARTIKQTLLNPDFDITTIYVNPSIARLTHAIIQLSAESSASKLSFIKHRGHVLDSIWQDLKPLVDNINPSEQLKVSKGHIGLTGREVILTGSTGSNGRFTLRKLLDSPQVSHVYCLNRARGSKVSRNSTRNVHTNGSSSRVTYITVDFSKEDLGLDFEIYGKLRTRATDIFHVAWPVNFNTSVDSFRPSLVGIVNLLKLAASGTHHPSMLFVSSISSVSSYSSGGSSIPEEVITDNSAPRPMGYGESKYLAEHLLDYAARKFPKLDIRVARVGQLAGPATMTGSWNKWEWLPSMIISSLHLGVIPDTFGNSKRQVDWIPIDIVARILLEIVFDDSAVVKKTTGAKFFHILNPQPQPWHRLLPVVIDSLNSTSQTNGARQIRAVPYQEWLGRLREEAASVKSDELETMLELVPALKLMAFFEGLLEDEDPPSFDLKKTTEASKHFRELEGIRGEWMRKWINDWVRDGNSNDSR